jgi:hypothetical protein
MLRRFLALLALTAPPALAQQVPPQSVQQAPPQPAATVLAEPVAMMIAAFDADSDARVTRAEFAQGLRQSFDALDSRRTGALGYVGFSDWAERWLGDRNTLPSPFETDRDGDNRITHDELAQRFELLFARFDADRDGVLVRRELVTVRPPAPLPGAEGERRRRRD